MNKLRNISLALKQGSIRLSNNQKWSGCGNNRYFFSISFEIYPVNDLIYSIVFSEESYTGGANGEHYAKVFIVDLDNSRVIQPHEIVKQTNESLEKLYEFLLAAFQDSEYEEMLFEEDLKNWVENKERPLPSLFVTNEALKSNLVSTK